MLKQVSSRKLQHRSGHEAFWQKRYYDFNVWTERKRIEKMRYMHHNPVKRRLVEDPKDWKRSSYRHYLTGIEGLVEIESEWTARKREQMGIVAKINRKA
jgi:putative transposase